MNQTFLGNALDQYEHGLRANLWHANRALELEKTKLKDRLGSTGFWFVDVPRTSSSFVKAHLEKRWGYPYSKNSLFASSCLLPPHTPAHFLLDFLGADLWASIRSVSVVRNPYDWVVSLWGFVNDYEGLGFRKDSLHGFLEDLAKNLSVPIGHREVHPYHFCQADYLTEADGNRILVGEVLKFEERCQITEFLESLGFLDIDSRKIMDTKSPKHKLSATEKKMVHKILAKDFDVFGY